MEINEKIKAHSAVAKQLVSSCVYSLVDLSHRYGWKVAKLKRSKYGSWYVKLRHSVRGVQLKVRVSDHVGVYIADGRKNFEVLVFRIGDSISSVLDILRLPSSSSDGGKCEASI